MGLSSASRFGSGEPKLLGKRFQSGQGYLNLFGSPNAILRDNRAEQNVSGKGAPAGAHFERPLRPRGPERRCLPLGVKFQTDRCTQKSGAFCQSTRPNATSVFANGSTPSQSHQ